MTPSPEALLRAGPLLLFAMAAAETAMPVGILVPAGVAFSTAIFLSQQGLLGWEALVPAAIAGAFAGDSLGFWLGRRSSPLLRRTPGSIGRLVRGARLRTAGIFHSHALWAVSGGRTISFVRTFMPATAGASGLAYPRFLLFDALGILLWATLYVTIGLAAAEGWNALARRTGSAALPVLLVGLAGVGFLLWARRSRRRLEAKARALHVALTGNAASGKSTVAEAWARAGVPVVSADELAREAVRPGSRGLAEVTAAFGREVLTPGGELDRAALRDRIFRDDGERERLEAILHPRIAELREGWARERESEGERLLVSEIPLLFEAGLADAFDRVVVVDAPRAERKRRLVEERGLDPAEADRVLDAQGDPEEKRRGADHLLENGGTVAELEAAARALLERLRAEAARPAETRG